MQRPFSPRPPPRRPAERARRPGGERGPPTREASRDQRQHERDLVCVCGLAAVAALCATDIRRIERLFFEPRLASGLKEVRRILGKAHKPYREVDGEELARIAGTVRHGGVVAVTRPRPVLPLDAALAASWARDGRPLLILDGIGNPHNLGAIVRSAAFFGVQHIVLSDRPEQALPSAASYRVAEGALDRVTLHRASLVAVLPLLKRSYRIVGTALDRGTPLAAFRRDRPVALIVGNEESGVEPPILALCDTVVTIAGTGQVQSLNVAAAVSVMLYALAAG